MDNPATSDPISAVTQRAGRAPRRDGEDDPSSGMFGETLLPAAEEARVAATPPISPDSAETEHLLPSDPHEPDAMEGEVVREEEEERPAHTDPPWIHAKDTAMFDLDHLTTTAASPPPATTHPPSPSNPSSPDVLHVDFFDPASRRRNLDLAPPSPSSLAHELQGGDATSWAMPENYDYITPYEDGVSPTVEEDTYSTTTDAYETDEDLREAAGSPARSKPGVPGSDSFFPGFGIPVPSIRGAANPMVSSNGCRAGYQMVNGSCRSACDMQPNYCFNGGQCYQLGGEELFCR